MDSPCLNRLDVFEIYRRYCDIKSGNVYSCGDAGYRLDDESRRSKFSREALAQLLKLIESGVNTRLSIFDELSKLMSQLDLMADFSKFSRFYDFVFFACRENGQKNITVRRAVYAWRLVLVGRFRLLNQWCDFVEKNQRHNIAEDTWQQVLAFSRCVHENLEGYDPEGAWPVLIDDFVEHMYRVSGSTESPNCCCNCGDSQSQVSIYEDTLPGLKIYPGLKRKLIDIEKDEMESSDILTPDSTNQNVELNFKRSRLITDRGLIQEDSLPGRWMDDSMESIICNSQVASSKSPCSVEGCLSKGFAGLFSTRSYLHFNQERRVT